jgi:orotate phosphoribosyltransferase
MKLESKERINDIFERARNYFRLEGVVKMSTHLYRSGLGAPWYVDFDNIANDPVRCREATLLYAHTIEEIMRLRNVDFLGFIDKSEGGTVGTIRLAGAISILTDIPSVAIRPGKDISHERLKIPLQKGRIGENRACQATCIILTDHCTTGSEVIESIRAAESNGVKVTDIIAYTRSSEFDSQEFTQKGIEFHWFYETPRDLKKVGIDVMESQAGQ